MGGKELVSAMCSPPESGEPRIPTPDPKGECRVSATGAVLPVSEPRQLCFDAGGWDFCPISADLDAGTLANALRRRRTVSVCAGLQAGKAGTLRLLCSYCRLTTAVNRAQ